METISKLITAAVVLGIAAMLINAYGDMKYDAGWQSATDEQAKVAADLQKELDKEKADGLRRLADLQGQLSITMTQLNKVKEDALLKDESYRKWRETPLHPVAVQRIWKLCHPSPGSGDCTVPGR